MRHVLKVLTKFYVVLLFYLELYLCLKNKNAQKHKHNHETTVDKRVNICSLEKWGKLIKFMHKAAIMLKMYSIVNDFSTHF